MSPASQMPVNAGIINAVHGVRVGQKTAESMKGYASGASEADGATEREATTKPLGLWCCDEEKTQHVAHTNAGHARDV